jgi:hypothetical protein
VWDSARAEPPGALMGGPAHRPQPWSVEPEIPPPRSPRVLSQV